MGISGIDSVNSDVPLFVEASYKGDYHYGSHRLDHRIPWHITRDKAPPTKGWYNASEGDSRSVFRYWDGQKWSTPVHISLTSQKDPSRWEEARKVTVPSLTNRSMRWRNVKPYFPGEEWDFLRE